MPQLFRSIALNNGKNVSVSMYAPGGTGFVNHYVDPNVYALFREPWDVVVLQPGSGESAGASWPVDTTVYRGRILLDSIYSYSPCAKVFIYQIPYGVPSENDYNVYFSVQDRIRDSITKLSDSMGIPFLPAGQCARAYYEMHQNLLLHGGYNDIHPNLNGSFLVASTFYSGIFREQVSQTTYYSSVMPDTAVIFFNIVDTVVLNHLNDWRLNTFNLSADFSSNISGGDVSFSSLAVNAVNVEWDFGDGNSSSETNPTHTYTSNGEFWVTQFAFQNSCIDSISKKITIATVGVNQVTTVENGALQCNPVNGNPLLYLQNPSIVSRVEVLDATGKRVFLLENPTENNLVLPIDTAGSYFVVINNSSGFQQLRLIITD
ncbi:MAG: PKD domain-containing protein [Fluviicola sp.]|nr:PKD domain-containing protein [Fluviicola sp.]